MNATTTISSLSSSPSRTVESFEIARNDPPSRNVDSNQPFDTNEASGWLIIAAAWAIIFIGVGYTNAFGVFQEYYQTTLFPKTSPSAIILIGSVASSLYMILGVFAGRFADLVGYQISLSVGSILMVGGLFAASASHEFYQFFLAQGVMFGLGLAFAYLPAVTISRQYYGAQRHGLVNGIVVSGGGMGGCVLPPIVRILLEKYGLPTTFRCLGGVAVGVLFPSILLLRPKASYPVRRTGRILDASLLGDSRFVALLVTTTIAMTGFLPRYFLITPSAIHMGVSPAYAAWLLGMMNGLSVIGRVAIGWIADRYGKVAALVSSFSLCGLGHLVFWLPSVLVRDTASVTGLLTAFAVYTGLFGSGFVSLLPVVVAHLFGSSMLASKVGLLNSVVGVGVLAGPSAVYAIVADDEDWSVGILTAGLFMLVGGLGLAGGLGLTKKREHDEL